MLKQLYIKNYALFSETQVDFQSGLSILTGETGAGKSLLVGALGLITGKRADNSVVFRSEDKCIVEARFDHLSSRIMKQLRNHDAFDLEGSELMIRREIRYNGKSRAFINDTPVSLQVLRQVSSELVDLHSQHENLGILLPEKQIGLLDTFAGCEKKVELFSDKLAESDQLLREIRNLEKKESEAKEQLAYFTYQIQELERAEIKADEETQLEQELNLLQNSEQIREAMGGATEMLYHQDPSLYSQLSELLEPLRKIANVSTQISEEVDRLTDVQHILKESAFAFQDLLDAVESDPERLAFIEERLAIYHQLKLKYNVKSGEELMAKYHEFKSEMGEYESIDERIQELNDTHSLHMEALTELGLKIEQKRKTACVILEKEIHRLLKEVGFEKARFSIDLQRNEVPESRLVIEGKPIKATNRGINTVSFLIQTNPGMPAGTLAQIASGGEISRVMLAVKAAMAEKSEFPVLIFDEIDTGISGEIAHKVGLVMHKLGRKFQLIAITHLPQIAARGDQHYQIYKEVKGNMTTSSVVKLNREKRITELAKMLSGDQPTPSAIQNATELMAIS